MTPLTIYSGLAGDRNPRGMQGAAVLGAAFAAATGHAVNIVGTPAAPVAGGWAAQLETASPDLRRLQYAVGAVLERGERPLSAMGRCAASIATLPEIARWHPEAAIVWFDAHGDCNLPHGEDNYLGGMVLTGAAGLWNTGLGAGFGLDRAVLVGSRDLDPPELERIAHGEVAHVPGGPDLAQRLRAAVRGRPVYVHIDCDVLDAGLVATEYQVPDGLSFADLNAACTALAEGSVVGLEVTEFEAAWPDGRPCAPDDLMAALAPLLDMFR